MGVILMLLVGGCLVALAVMFYLSQRSPGTPREEAPSGEGLPFMEPLEEAEQQRH